MPIRYGTYVRHILGSCDNAASSAMNHRPWRLAVFGLIFCSSATYGQALTIATSNFPAIYVAGGSVYCGSSLLPDICSQLPDLPINSLLRNVTTSITYVTQSQVSATQVVGTYTTYYFPVVAITGSFQLPLTRIALETAYTPTVIATENLPQTTTFTTNHQKARRSVPLTDYRYQRRGYYDYNSCTGDTPNHDLVTNSLSDVCHFVANAQSYFVSLRPTSAAYMPSWLGFVFQIIVSAWSLISFVSLHAERANNS